MSTTNYSVVGIDDAGHIAGGLACGNGPLPPVDDPGPDDPFFMYIGCYWTNSSSTPFALGEGESSVNGYYALWDGFVTSISAEGYMEPVPQPAARLWAANDFFHKKIGFGRRRQKRCSIS